MTIIEHLIDYLEKRKNSVSCTGKKGLLVSLESIGFIHKEGKAVGHRVFTHPELSRVTLYTTHSVDCGHKPNREMKPVYISNTIRVLKTYKDELEAINDNSTI